MIRKIVIVVDDRVPASLRTAATQTPLGAWMRECVASSLLDALSRAVRSRDASLFGLVAPRNRRTPLVANSTAHVAAALSSAGDNDRDDDANVSVESMVRDALRALVRCRVAADESTIVIVAYENDATASLRQRLEAIASAERNVRFALIAVTGAADRPNDKHRVAVRANLRAYVVPAWAELDAVARKAGAALGVGAVAAAAVAGKAVSQALLDSAPGAAGADGGDVRLDVHVALQLGHQRVRSRLVPLGPCDAATARHVAAIAARQPVFSVLGFCYAADLLAGPVSAFAIPFALRPGDARGGERECELDSALLLRGLSMALADEDSCAVLQVCLSKQSRGGAAAADGAPTVTHAVLRPSAERGSWPVLVFARDQTVAVDQRATWADLAAAVTLPAPQRASAATSAATNAAAAATPEAPTAVTPAKRKRNRPISATRQAQLAKEAASQLAAHRAASSLYSGAVRADDDEQTPTRLLAQLTAALSSPSSFDEAKFRGALERLKLLATAFAWPHLHEAAERAERTQAQARTAKRRRRRSSSAAAAVAAPATTVIKIPARATRHLVSDAVLQERRRERRRVRERERRAAQRLAKSGGGGGGGGGGNDDDASSSSSGDNEASLDLSSTDSAASSGSQSGAEDDDGDDDSDGASEAASEDEALLGLAALAAAARH